MKKIKLSSIIFLLAITGTVFAQAPRPSQSQLLIRFDEAPQETTWELTNIAGNVVQSGGPYDSRFAQKVVAIEFTQAFGSGLSLTIKDSGNNGLSNNGAWAINTARSSSRIELRNADQSAVGNRILNGDRNFGSEITVPIVFSDRADNLGQLGEVSINDIFLTQVLNGDFYQIVNNRYQLVDLGQTPPDETPDTPNLGDIRNSFSLRTTGRNPGVVIFSGQEVSNERATLQLFNNNGGLILTRDLVLNTGRRRVNFNNIPRGVYIVNFQTENSSGRITRRFFVRRRR